MSNYVKSTVSSLFCFGGEKGLGIFSCQTTQMSTIKVLVSFLTVSLTLSHIMCNGHFLFLMKPEKYFTNTIVCPNSTAVLYLFASNNNRFHLDMSGIKLYRIFRFKDQKSSRTKVAITSSADTRNSTRRPKWTG